MPYFRVDDGWWSHPKTQALSGEAQALWVRAGCWSMQHYTDGLIPANMLAMLGAKPRLVKELVEVGYWHKVLPGHQFHDWAQYQETAEKLKERRDKNKERMRAVRNSVHAHNEDTDDARADAVRDVIPSHPIPSPVTGVDDAPPAPETGGENGPEPAAISVELLRRAGALQVDLAKVCKALNRRLGKPVTPEVAFGHCITVVGRAKGRSGDRTGLILKDIAGRWAEWERVAEEAA